MKKPKHTHRRPYVSGPIAGADHLSREEKLKRFSRAELVLRNQGFEPVNPLGVEACSTRDCTDVAEFHPDGTFKHTWECWLRYDLIAMLEQADSIAMLPEWETSSGARLEHQVAVALGFPVIDLTKNAVVLGLPHRLGH